MNKFNFKEIIIVGNGRVAKECLKIATNFFKHQTTKLIQSQTQNSKNLDDYFSTLKDCLIVSANNFYLFKKDCIAKNTLINYHNALLPNHRGLNAHIFAIWENDAINGISWHKIDNGIDTGNILIQQEIPILENLTALDLLLKQHKIAIQTFQIALENLLKNIAIPQKSQDLKYHKKTDLPNDGILELSWELQKISRFLRSMDLGCFREIPYPKLKLFGEETAIKFYTIAQDTFNLSLENGMQLKITKE